MSSLRFVYDVNITQVDTLMQHFVSHTRTFLVNISIDTIYCVTYTITKTKGDVVQIQEYLKQNGITQVHVAKTLGISYTHMCSLCTRRRKPSVTIARQLHELSNGEISKYELVFPEDFED